MILAAPVFDRSTRKFIGLVDIIDLVAYALCIFTDSAVKDTPVKLTDFTVKYFKDGSTHNPWCPVFTKAPLTSLIDIFAKSKIHRVPLTNDDGKVVGLISQSRVLQFLFDNQALLPMSALEAPVSRAMTTPVKSCHETCRTADAFSKLIDEAISGIAVVDDSGRLTGYLSANHLKGASLGNDQWNDFYLPVKVFIANCNAKYKAKATGPVCLRPSDTVGEALRLLHSLRLHRLWIIDSESKPVGVLSLSDIINFVDEQP